MMVSWKGLLVSLLILAAGICLSAQEPADLVGTWSGTATLDGQAEPNELTLVLELAEGELTGHITGEYGTLSQSEIREVSLDNDLLVFTVDAESGGGPIAIVFNMKISGEEMKGEMEVPDMGLGGTWEAVRRK